MNENFPNASESFKRRNPHLFGGIYDGTHSVDKKLDVCHRGQKKPRVEAPLRQRFRVTIDFLISDQRNRDLDAGTSTILDCIIAARRQLEGDFRTSRYLSKGEARR